MTNEELHNLYLKEPARWDPILMSEMTDAKAAMAIGYLSMYGKKSLQAVGDEHGVTGEQIRLVKNSALAIIQRHQEGAPERTLPKTRAGVPLSQAEFDTIKQLLFKGETQHYIAQTCHRSTYTVGVIAKSKDLATYFANTRKYLMKPSLDKSPQEAPSPVGPTQRYGRLKEAREKFDTVLIDFILGEVAEAHTALVSENTTLRAENERLHKLVEQLSEPDFTKTLQERLQPESNGKEVSP